MLTNTEKSVIKQLTTLFKYVPDSNKVLDGIFRDHKIRFTQPAGMNDPLEFNPAIRFNSDGDNYKRYEYRGVIMPSIRDWEHINLIEPRINKFGILSLTDNPYSFEMWSHYANGHKGVLIEFNVSDKSRPTLQLMEGVKPLKVHKVKYVKDYEINIDLLYQKNNSIPFYKIRDAIFLKKTRHWKYEREYRIVRQLAECDTYHLPVKRTSYRDKKVYLFPLSLSCITSVVFGVNTSQKVKRKIIESCKNTKINFLQMVIYKDLQNKFKILPINYFGPINKYLSMLPQVFTSDSIEIKYNRDYIHINSLSELPYYHLQRNDMKKYYKKQLAKKI